MVTNSLGQNNTDSTAERREEEQEQISEYFTFTETCHVIWSTAHSDSKYMTQYLMKIFGPFRVQVTIRLL